MAKKVIIIGGVAGGASTAARLRRLDESLEIILIEKGEVISYANCGLPYYIGDVISARERLFLQTPEGMNRRFRIDVRVRHEVQAIDRDHHEVVIHDLSQDRVYRESYDKLVISTGSVPIIPKVPGIDLPKVFTLRNVPDTDRIKNFLQANKLNSAVVIGGGFIGLEMAENLINLKKQVTLVEMANQVLGNLDFELAAVVHRELRNQGVELILGNGLAAISESGKNLELVLNDGRKIVTEMVILAVGVKPEARLAREAGLEIGVTGAIQIGPGFQTSDPDVLAIGDAVEVKEILAGKPFWAPLAGPANHQGRMLADCLSGREYNYRGVQATAIVKVFDLTAGSTGFNEKTLTKWGIPYLSSIIHVNSHATYYPGALPLTIKLIFAPDNGRIFGAQVVGYEGVDKRLDVPATALHFDKSVFDLRELELAYAPPFSSAKDPVNIAGYAASNIISHDVDAITWSQLLAEDHPNRVLLDVREPVEVQIGAIPGAVNIPVDQLRHRLDELPHDREIVTYCQVGLRAYLATRILKQNGFERVKNLSGGFKTFELVQHDRERALETSPVLKPVANNQTVALKEDAKMGEMIKLNACGLQCPGPILQVYNKMQLMGEGEVLEVTASDPGFANDIEAWSQRTGNTLLGLEREPGKIVARIRKGKTVAAINGINNNQDKTLVVFSGDLDKAIASFIIATGAASMGRKVTMFFTFWGLNVLRKPQRVKAKKGLMDRMFGMMMPRGSVKLGLSRMNMGGMGAWMIRSVMRRKNVVALESMISQARVLGIKLVACQMSMDVMGIKPEELLEGVEIGGVASYLAAAEESNVNLFI